MDYSNNKRQKIIVSALLRNKNKQMLVIRSTDMPEHINDDEYFCIPSWEVPFGISPEEKIVQELQKMLEGKVQLDSVSSTKSYLSENEMTHVIEIIYNASASKSTCTIANNCISLNFINRNEIDSYILSERLKIILREE